MSVVLWVTVALLVLSALVIVTAIGKPREPITPRTAAISVSLQMVLAVAILIDRGVIRS